MTNKKYIFSPDKPKVLPVYLLSLALSIWGSINVFYWEIYKGYRACAFCEWHRAIYITLFVLLLMLFKYKKFFIKFLVWIALISEGLVILLQIFEPCSDLTCRYVSLPDKLNLIFVVGTTILIFIFELKAYLKYQKKLSLQVKHVDHFPNVKIGYKSNVCV